MTRSEPCGRSPAPGAPPLPPLARRTLSRRGLLSAGLYGGLAASLAGCGGAAAGASQDVRFWSLFSGGDGARMETMLEAVRQETGIDIRNTVLAWGAPYYTKLAMSSAGGRSPELAVLHLSRLAGYAPGGFLDPWDLDLLAEFDVREEHFPETVWQRAQHDGRLYAVPLDTHPFVVMYDIDVAERARLLDADAKLVPITSPQEFLAAGRALAEVTGDVGVSFGFQNDTSQLWRLFYGLYTQGAPEWDLTGSTLEVDRDVATSVLEFTAAVLDGTVADPSLDYTAGLATFISGRAGMILTGEWELPAFLDAEIPLGASPVPTMFGQPSAYADAHSFVLPHQDAPDPQRRRATHEAVAALLKESFTWAEAGHVPSYGPIVESPAYAELEPQSDYAPTAGFAVLDPAAWFTGAGANFQNLMTQAMLPTVEGSAPPEAAIDGMVARVEELLATPNPVGEPA
ncbi:extracellular solute-binding protein [Quadrisphaera sp. DSM 44207]|uniref:extracellular solute-binding protein n=1 Tax=Quadrisphaera sp. DSM 44207 TaxID=1881057 RepID=UPI000B86C95C|nr:extracellular solute-binding protein [Quadrisphaera sp. DSM 44207]